MLATSTALPKPTTASADVKDDPDRVDERLQFLTRHILPTSPYLLSVPTKSPYRVAPHQQDNWRVGVPFAADEEELQYMSFLPRDRDDGLLVARANWETNGAMEGAADGQSGTATPVNGNLKKISLSTYKNKKKEGAVSDVAEQGVIVEAKGVNGAETKPAAAGSPTGPETNEAPQVRGKGEKHSANGHEEAPRAEQKVAKEALKAVEPRDNSPQGMKRPAKSGGESPAKRPRTTSSSVRSLPRLISPTLPPEVEGDLIKWSSELTKLEELEEAEEEAERKKHELDVPPKATARPETLLKAAEGLTKSSSSKAASQSLPKKSVDPSKTKKAENTLAKDVSQHKKSQSSSSSGSDPRQPSGLPKPLAADAKQDQLAGKTPRKHPSAPEVAKKTQGADKSVAPETKGPPKATRIVSNGTTSTGFFNGLRTGVYSSPALTASSNPNKTPVPPQPSRIVSMKFSRLNKPALQRVLNQPSDGKDAASSQKGMKQDQGKRDPESGRKDHLPQEKDRIRPAEVQSKDKAKAGMEKSASTGSPSIGVKRARAPEDDRAHDGPSKRAKAPEHKSPEKKPQTPNTSALKTSTSSTPAMAEKVALSTSRNDPKGKAIRRVESSEMRATTPQGTHDRHVDTMSTPGKATGPGSEARQTEPEAWTAEYKKRSSLGRELKVEATKLLRLLSDEDPSEKKSFKLGVALAIESLLCYFLAFSADDEYRRITKKRSTIENWRSLMPLWVFFEEKCQVFPRLHGLCLQIGAVVREKVHDSERDSFASVLEPGSSIPEDRQNRMTEHFRNDINRQSLWQAGWKKLTAENIRKEFPKTWARRMTNEDGGASIRQERLSPENWGENYRCPLMSNVTTPLEAVRMGAVLLQEFAELNDLEWKDNLGIL
ncbi:MAG: hypothetical protein M4579_002377 [Chaenotheca gracillima]|nr:MAG: hypothetical protein M4579_002377 [Chaenotheca gracillima]